ncbi:ubiquitin domain-containing protein 7SL RNA2-like [Lathyrus oleraceus]|uniref:ubiquitin domain-containing protein 7SL RNA2-like n=1 Tax=Pisum sativum TaxID=3888 RepID=UPI001FC5EA40|nr:ubiquitin domain-containing protein 7SL RNA2-like [Pisum sativum]
MDVTFEVQRGRSFSIEIGFFDTILEIKEKVQKYQGIPISNQTLIFNGQILQDDGDIWKCAIFQNSRIYLMVAAADSDHSKLPIDHDIKFHPNDKTPSSKSHIPIEIDKNDTALKLKEKIHDSDQNNVPFSNVMLHATGTELHDNQFLRDCDVSDKNEIEVSFKPQVSEAPTVVGGGGGGTSKKLKLMVLPKSGTKKVVVEMNHFDNVGELRKELHKLNQRLQFHLPPEGYFFIYKQNVMDDDKSFRWHHVCQGDTIEIFNGSVTGGS